MRGRLSNYDSPVLPEATYDVGVGERHMPFVGGGAVARFYACGVD